MRLILIALLVAGCSEKPQPVVTAADLCRAELTNWVKFKDPDSVRVEGFKHLRAYPDGADGHNGPVQSYEMQVNAKNSYGGYTGAKPYGCVVTAEGKIITLGAM